MVLRCYVRGVNIACIGGGPAGLYFGILVKRAAPEHDVVVYERDRPGETFGFGVVFSDATLGNLAAADPESHRQITERFARWDDIEVQVGGEVLRSTGHGFCGIERKALLQILQARADELGVRVVYQRAIHALSDPACVAADVVVACDGVASWVRDALRAELRPRVDVRPNKFVWLGCTVPYQAFTFLFKQTRHGLFRVHAYRYHADSSTFIVECRDETWRAAGLAEHDGRDEDRTLAILGDVFATELAGHRLIKNRSIWRNFPTVRCEKWHADNVVLVGDAAHTAHFSIGSGTKLAMEDVIVLRDELLADRDTPAALAAYEARRRPEVEALQAAAQASLEWFEGTERYAAMPPIQMTYSLMTRSLRVSHASVAKRDPHLAEGVERLLAAAVGVTQHPLPQPTALPFAIGDRRAGSRIVVADDALAPGAGMVVTTPLDAAATDTWRRIAESVHRQGALIAARIVHPDAAAIDRAASADFDLLVLDPGPDPAAIERLPATIASARSCWRATGWIAAVVHDRPAMRSAVASHAAQLVRAGADLLWVTANTNARLAALPLADRLRNELDVATCVDAGAAARLPDLDAAIAAGRADLVVIRRD